MFLCRLDQVYFITIFSTFSTFGLDNNFCFFEDANELIHIQIQLTFHRIYNDSKWNLEAVIWRVIFFKKPENFGESPWKKLLEEIYLLVSKSVGCRQIWHTLHPAWWVGEEGLKISGKYLLGSQTYLFWCWCWWGVL